MALFFASDLILALTAIALILAAQRRASTRRFALFLTLSGLGIAFLCLHTRAAFSGGGDFFVRDTLTVFAEQLLLLLAFAGALLAYFSPGLRQNLFFEYYALYLASVIGCLLLLKSSDFLSLLLALELLTLPTYALLHYGSPRASSEAALKYILYGSTATALMMFGISLHYGQSGGTSLYVALGTGALPSVFFIFIGFAFKLMIAPAHAWAADIYQGAPSPFMAFFSTAPKIAMFVLLGRWFSALPAEPYLFWAFSLLAALTMTLGNIAALLQNNLQRLLAYSGIAHAGYVFMVFCLRETAAAQAGLFYLFAYPVMNMGIFAVCQALSDTDPTDISRVRGLAARAPSLSLALLIFLLGLAGIPLTVGFIAKFYIFAALSKAGGDTALFLLLVFAVNTVVALYYYLRIARLLFFARESDSRPLQSSRGLSFTIAALALLTISLGLYWRPLLPP